MRRFALFLLFCGVLGSSLALASPASANTTVNVKMTFAEPAVNPDCAVTDGFCGQGVVLPLGPATETIEFGAACGGACDLRTINLAGGSIIADEYEHPTSLSGVIVGGTGMFAGATGTYSGTVRIAHDRVSIVTLTGTLTYDP
jgi:hypothetical protein